MKLNPLYVVKYVIYSCQALNRGIISYLSIVIARQPHFPNQPDDVKIFWGYGLYPDRKGNFVPKTMAQCSGEEILEELYYHLKIQDLMRPITDAGKVNCLPVAMPFIDSQFMILSINQNI